MAFAASATAFELQKGAQEKALKRGATKDSLALRPNHRHSH